MLIILSTELHLIRLGLSLWKYWNTKNKMLTIVFNLQDKKEKTFIFSLIFQGFTSSKVWQYLHSCTFIWWSGFDFSWAYKLRPALCLTKPESNVSDNRISGPNDWLANHLSSAVQCLSAWWICQLDEKTKIVKNMVWGNNNIKKYGLWKSETKQVRKTKENIFDKNQRGI